MNKYRVCISIINDNPIIFDTENEENVNFIINCIKYVLKDRIVAISKVEIYYEK